MASTSFEGEKDPTEYQYDQSKIRDISSSGLWAVSSCKAGYGVESVVDGSVETYWQSDGPQPHLLSVSFPRKLPIAAVAVYVDFKADESYTPSRIAVRVGSHPGDLRDLATWTLSQAIEEPVGWHTRPLANPANGAPLRAFMLQLAVQQNHQNGRDTHIRQVKVFSPLLPPPRRPLPPPALPRTSSQEPKEVEEPYAYEAPHFSSVDMQQYATIR